MGSCAKRSWPARGVSPEAQASRRSRRAVLLASCGGHRRDEPSIRTGRKEACCNRAAGKASRPMLIKSRQASWQRGARRHKLARAASVRRFTPAVQRRGCKLGTNRSVSEPALFRFRACEIRNKAGVIAKWKLDWVKCRDRRSRRRSAEQKQNWQALGF